MDFSFSPWRTGLGALMVLAAAAGWAADPLTLGDAQRVAVGRSQLLAANESAVAAAVKMASAAYPLPDPVLKMGVDNLPVNGADRFSLTRDFMTMRRIGIMQELPSAEKRKLRAQRLSADALKAQAEQQMTLASVQRSTAAAWIDRYYALALRRLIEEQVDEARLQVQSAETAYRGARGSQADVFAARSALSALQDRLSQVHRQERNAALMLARWVGPDADRPPDGAPPWQTTYLEHGLTVDHLRTHPDLALAAAVVEAAEAEARLANANRNSDWTVEANYSQRGSAFGNMVSIGVSVPLQLDRANRQDQELAAKLALVDEAKARYEDLLRNHEAEVRVMLGDWQTGKERLARYASELVPVAQQRAEAALAAYRGGKSDLASVLAARRDAIDMRTQALTLEMETARQWAQLNFLAADHSHQEQP
jgi:outer membrane protein TolC